MNQMQSERMLHDDPDATARRLAVVVREVLDTAQHDTLADLVDDLKTRAARLRIPWTGDDITAALEMVESNRALVPDRMPRRHVEQPLPPREDLDRELTTKRLKFFRRTLQQDGKLPVTRRPVIHPIGAAPLEPQRDLDRRRAMEIVTTEIQATVARCDALEREPCE